MKTGRSPALHLQTTCRERASSSETKCGVKSSRESGQGSRAALGKLPGPSRDGQTGSALDEHAGQICCSRKQHWPMLVTEYAPIIYSLQGKSKEAAKAQSREAVGVNWSPDDAQDRRSDAAATINGGEKALPKCLLSKLLQAHGLRRAASLVKYAQLFAFRILTISAIAPTISTRWA
jgi:hypothetical protein